MKKGVTDLNKIEYEKDAQALCRETSVVLAVIDNYEEFLETLRFSFTGNFRFYDNFVRDSRYVWVNKDATFRYFKYKKLYSCYLGRLSPFIYEMFKKGFKEAYTRTYVVKRDWVDETRKRLLSSKEMIDDLEKLTQPREFMSSSEKK